MFELDGVKDAAQARKWKRELQRAEKREKAWRDQAEKVIKQYRGDEKKKASFNILWANTELMRNALYNTPPKPDVRRRWGDADPLGKVTSTVMERAITYCVDRYDFDLTMKQDVLDLVLPGRAVSRIKYEPKIAGKPADDKTESTEELEDEGLCCEHVDWKDFRHGFGRTWKEVPWIGFKHLMEKGDVEAKFGDDTAEAIKYDLDRDDDDKKKPDDGSEFTKVAEFWEIWDKEKRKVFFFNEGHQELIYPTDNASGEPPLDFEGFWPVPRPMLVIEDSSSLLPQIHFEMYRQQADELNAISLRISKIVDACRVRGVYNSVLKELEQLQTAKDNEYIPASNVAAILAQGGDLTKSIWMAPIDTIATVLKELYVAESECKSKIYEITGLSDILRGETNPNETLGAQQIKANFGSLRLKRLQQEVRRYARDLVSMMGEVIGSKFTEKTLAQMTEVNIPTTEQKAQAKQLAQLAQTSGQQPPPQVMQVLQQPGWPEVMGLLRSDMQRSYRIDVETDSMIQESIETDMGAMKETMAGFESAVNTFGPLVLNKALPVDSFKSIMLTLARKSRLGLEFEDAIEGMSAPQAPTDPKAAAEAAQQQKEQALAQQQAQHQAQMAQREQAHEEAIAQRQAALEAQEQQLKEAEARHEAQLKQATAINDDEFRRWEVIENNKNKLEVAEVNKAATLQKAQADAANAAEADQDAEFGDAMSPTEPMPTTRPKNKAPLEQIAETVNAAHQASQERSDSNNQEILRRLDEHSQGIANLHRAVMADHVPERDPKTGKILRVRRVLQ